MIGYRTGNAGGAGSSPVTGTIHALIAQTVERLKPDCRIMFGFYALLSRG